MPRLPDDSVGNPPPIITLLTDFGASDVFVGSMKGVILGINPLAQIVDLSHEIPAHNIRVAAYLLHSAARYFRPGTIHVAVVDPGEDAVEELPVRALEKAGRFFFCSPRSFGAIAILFSHGVLAVSGGKRQPDPRPRAGGVPPRPSDYPATGDDK